MDIDISTVEDRRGSEGPGRSEEASGGPSHPARWAPDSVCLSRRRFDHARRCFNVQRPQICSAIIVGKIDSADSACRRFREYVNLIGSLDRGTPYLDTVFNPTWATRLE